MDSRAHHEGAPERAGVGVGRNTVANTAGLMPPWKPGQSGNPNGRPKVKPFRDAVRRVIAEAGDDKDMLKAVAAALLAKGMDGDVSAIKEIADRLDGKVPQTLQGDDEGGPIRLEVGWLTAGMSDGSSSPTDPETNS